MAAAALGPVVMLPGPAGQHWQCKSAGQPVQVPSGALIVGTPETVVDEAALGLGAETDAAFQHDAFFTAGGFATTLAATPILSVPELTLTTTVGLVGRLDVAVNHEPCRGQLHHVSRDQGSSGTSSPSIAPSYGPTSAGAGRHAALQRRRNIRILGNGMTIRMLGRRLASSSSWRPTIASAMTSSSTATGGGAATSSARGTAAESETRGAASASSTASAAALAHETQEFSTFEDCHAQSMSGPDVAGVSMNDSYGSLALNCTVAGTVGVGARAVVSASDPMGETAASTVASSAGRTTDRAP